METAHLEKIRELKERENETLTRVRNQEREVEKAAYEHRQKVLADMEILRHKESETKKTVEMELYLVKQEKQRLEKLEQEYQQRMREADMFKQTLEKQSLEAQQRFRSELQRTYQD